MTCHKVVASVCSYKYPATVQDGFHKSANYLKNKIECISLVLKMFMFSMGVNAIVFFLCTTVINEIAGRTLREY